MFRRLVQNSFLLANIGAIVLLLLSYLAGWVHPCKTVFFAFIGLAYPLILLLNVAFVVFWAITRKYWYLLSLVSILIGYRPLTNYFNMVPANLFTNSKQQADFTLLSYNVRVFNLYNWNNNIALRDSILHYVKQNGADIACFQEYYNHTGNTFPVDKPLRKQGLKNAHIHVISTVGQHQQFGIATYTRFPIVNKGQVNFLNTGNTAIFTDINVNGTIVRVYNCHLESVRFSYDDYITLDEFKAHKTDQRITRFKGIYQRLARAFCKRGWQAALVNKHCRQSPYPVIVCGDFNDPPNSYTYTSVAKRLRDAYRENNIGRGTTFNRGL
jgi:endonuclease/exonuclease/phosphatase family metal-dependent hydrolase